ncbi:MAG: Smr/MutS family protein [Alistipes sp.]|nr:Smr/MutS family protein [Alistipes sp.]
MIYPQSFEQKIGFDRLREQIVMLCNTQAGRAIIEAESFSTSRSDIERRQDIADEMRVLLMLETDAPRDEYPDMEGIIAKIAVEGAFLDVEELARLRVALTAVGNMVAFVMQSSEKQYPRLRARCERVCIFPDIIRRINQLIDEESQIKDGASQELLYIRRSIREHEGQVSKRLQQVLMNAKKAGIVDVDATLSIRDGRAVIPVSASNKRKLNGFIHDESATGRTFYVEPVEVVELNNALKELEYAERREIVRLLTEFTDEIRPDAEPLAAAAEYLAEMDAVRAKARWAMENGAGKPIVSLDGRLVLRKASHPLLAQTLRREKKELIPLDLQLDSEKHILVISGPNAGGKSVCLKTTGIVQYMFQCGFPVTAGENSELPIFDHICIDIGDEQSMDNDLSTYSSHLLNMKNMLQLASAKTLVLIDEFGSGTEPVIGGALAESILERLLDRGSYGVITTHYSNIKYFATGHEGVANGAMMFDVQNIRPLFKLEQGKPGSSFAIEIARKIGLPEDIIRRASDKAGSDHINLERQLREIARDRHYWSQKRDRIRQTDRKVEELESSYASQLSRIKEERREILGKAREQAEKLIADANREIENTIRTIREAQAEKELTRLARKELEEFKQAVESVENNQDSQKVEREMERLMRRQARREEGKKRRGEAVETPKVEAKPVAKVIEVGSKVKIAGQEVLGVVQAVKGKKAQVAFGQILTSVDCAKLTVVSNAEYKKSIRPVTPRTVLSVDISTRKLNFKDSVDVRGMRAVEALAVVQDLIDDALMVGVGGVTILHGKGTGALKEEIRRYLNSIPAVASAKDEHADRGGAGITVVRFHND